MGETAPAGSPPEGQQAPAEEDKRGLRQAIADVLGDLFGAGKADVSEGGAAAQQQQGPDVASQVKTEVQKIREREQRATERETDRERITRLEADLAAAKTPPPREWRRSTRLMGWNKGGDD